MNNSIIKLEDFELDEISGGITAKTLGALAIKGTSSLVLGVGTFTLSYFVSYKSECINQLYDFLRKSLDEKLGDFLAFDICCAIPTAFAGVAGWKLGELICKKLGLED